MNKLKTALCLLIFLASVGFVSGALAVAPNCETNPTHPSCDNPEPVDVTICHATASESNPYTINLVSVHSVGDANGLSGHGDHSGDIWASFTFDGLTYDGQGDTSSVDSGCDPVVPDDDEVLGCTDPEATNYNPDATEDNRTCEYPDDDPVFGCTDSEANNYDPEATEDNQSCEYDQTPTPTPTCAPGSNLVNGECTHPQPQNGVPGLSEAQPPAGTGGAVLGASTGQVLGASTMAGTGVAADTAMNLLGGIGSLFMGVSLLPKKRK